MVCLCVSSKSVDPVKTPNDGDVRAVYVRGDNSIRVWRQLAVLARTMKSIEAFSWNNIRPINCTPWDSTTGTEQVESRNSVNPISIYHH